MTPLTQAQLDLARSNATQAPTQSSANLTPRLRLTARAWVALAILFVVAASLLWFAWPDTIPQDINLNHRDMLNSKNFQVEPSGLASFRPIKVDVEA